MGPSGSWNSALVLRVDLAYGIDDETEALASEFTETGRGGGMAEIMRGDEGGRTTNSDGIEQSGGEGPITPNSRNQMIVRS